MRKKVMLVILVCLVTGCAPLKPAGCHKTTALGSCDSGRFTDQDEYGRQANAIRLSIQARLGDMDAWKGKRCRLHLDFARDGKLINIETRAGNKAFCGALKKAAESATFPPFPSEAVYNAFAGARFVIQG